MTGRQGRRHKEILNDHQEMRVYLKLTEEALDHILWRTGFGRGYGPAIRLWNE